MIAFVAFATVAAIVLGFAQGGILGALTGLVAAMGTGSGVAIMLNAKGTNLAAGGPVRHAQRIGGAMAAAACLLGTIQGGWRFGWLWGLSGYVVGMGTALILGSIGSTRAATKAALEGLPTASPGHLPIIDVTDFLSRTIGGRPNQMEMGPYENHPFHCACGRSHTFRSGYVSVLRELTGMRLVLACPDTDAITCVKVKGLLRFEGFDSLFGAREAPANDGGTA